MAAPPPGADTQPTLLTYNSIRPLATATEIENFGSFLKERCGSLEAGFTAIDAAQLGHLTSDTFSKGVSRLGYTLDPAPVFHALDNSRHGTVDLQRFMNKLTKQGGRNVGPELGSTAIQKILSGQFKAAPKREPGPVRAPVRANTMQDLGNKLERLEAEMAVLKERTQQQQNWRQETEARIDSQLSMSGLHTAEQLDGLREKINFAASIGSSCDLDAGKASGSAQDFRINLERLEAEVAGVKDRAQTQQRVWQEAQARIDAQLASMSAVHTAEQMDSLREKLDLAVARQKDELDALRDRCSRVDSDMIRTLVDDRMATCRAVLVQEHSQAMVAAKAAANDTSKLKEYVRDQIVSARAHSEELVADLRRDIKFRAVSDSAPGNVRASVIQDGGATGIEIVAQEAREAVKALRAESQQQVDRILERISTLDLRLEATGRLMGEESEVQVSKGLQLRTDMVQRIDALSERLEAVGTRAIAAETRVQEIAARPRDGCSLEEVAEIVSKAVGSLDGSLARIAKVEGITVNTHQGLEALQKTIADLEGRMVEMSSMQGSLMGDDVARSIHTAVLAEVQGEVHDELRQLAAFRASESARSVSNGAEGIADAAAGRMETEEALAQALLQLEQDATRLDERVAVLERQSTYKESSDVQIGKLSARIVETELGLQSVQPIAEGGVAAASLTATRLGKLEAKVGQLLSSDDADSRRRLEQIERSCSERLVAAEHALADVRSEARAQASAVERLQQGMLVERSRQDARQQASSDAMLARLQALISKVDGRCAEGGPSANAELNPRPRLSLATMGGAQGPLGSGDICSTTERTSDTPALSEHSQANPFLAISERNPRSPHNADRSRALAGHPIGPSRWRTFTPVEAASDRTISSKPSTPVNAGSLACSASAYRPHGSGSSRPMSQEPHDGEQRSTLARTAKVLQDLREENLRLREVNVEMRESVFEGMLGGSKAQLEAVLEAAVQQAVAPQAAMVMAVPAAGPGVDIAPCQSPGAGSCHLAVTRHAQSPPRASSRHAQASSPPPVSRYTSVSGTQQRTQLMSGSSNSARPSIVSAQAVRRTSGILSKGYNSLEGLTTPASTLSEPTPAPGTLNAPRGSVVYAARRPVSMR